MDDVRLFFPSIDFLVSISISIPSSSLPPHPPDHTSLHEHSIVMPWLFTSLTHPPVLTNTGSVARDHLALERTYLAWLRTSLTLTSVGIALSQFFRLPKGWVDEDRVGMVVGDCGCSSTFPRQQQWQVQPLVSTSTSTVVEGVDSVFFSPTYYGLEGNVVNDLAKPMGSAFILIGILTLLFGTWRYFTVQAQLIRTSYLPSRLEAITITFLVGTLLSAVLAVILASPSPSAPPTSHTPPRQSFVV